MAAVSDWMIIRGNNEPPPAAIRLRAGHLSIDLVGSDLRAVRLGEVEILRRLHVAVRDEAWGTVPESIADWSLDHGEDWFELAFVAHHRQGALDFSWHGQVTGASDGALVYSIDGEANSDFAYGRIGLVVLHPPETAGRLYRAAGRRDGSHGRLPRYIGPQLIQDGTAIALFEPFTALTLEHPGGLSVRFDFEGDDFEMEDQRNWTDASFKTYSTPLALGGRHEIRKGARLAQRVTVSVAGARRRAVSAVNLVTRVALGDPMRRGLPALGFQLPTHGQQLTKRQLQLLMRLRPDHVRVELDLETPAAAIAELKRGTETAAALNAGIELALIFAGDHHSDSFASTSGIKRLASMLSHTRVDRVIVLYQPQPDTTQPLADASTVEFARSVFGEAIAPTTFCAGTNGQFDDVNRSRVPLDGVGGLAYAITPQFHAFDDRSVIENLEAQADTVVSASRLAKGIPIIVSSVTLRPRSAPFKGPGPLPTSVDPRQMSMLAAAWTLGSVSELVAAGVSAATYYELNGWRGLMETPHGPPDTAFPSQPGMIFPVYHVFAALADWGSAAVLSTTVSPRLSVAALAFRLGGRTRILIANLRPELQVVEIGLEPSLGDRATDVTLAALIDHEVEELTTRIDLFEELWRPLDVRNGTVGMELPPYAFAVVDTGHLTCGS